MTHEDVSTQELRRRIAAGSDSAVDTFLGRYRSRLRRMVELRMDPRVAARVDASDIVQDAITEAARRLPHYAEADVPAYVWLRKLAWERLVQVHRQHVDAKKRTVRREARLAPAAADASADLLAEQLAASQTSPSGQATRREVCERVRTALDDLSVGDREVLVLRHLEQLTLREISAILDISEAAAQSRYRRAVERAHGLLSDLGPEL